MDSKVPFPANANTMNAIVTAMGGLAFALTLRLPKEQQKQLQIDLSTLAQSRNAAGDTTAGTLLLDLAGAVEKARS